jgi:hypothetical protein
VNTKTLTEADADLYEVEMATRRKQLAPFINDLLSPEAKADCAKLAIFDRLVEKLHGGLYHNEWGGAHDVLKECRAIQASVKP